MNKIKKYLDEASIAYYSGTPVISDEVFDRLAQSIGYAEVGAKQHTNVCKHYKQMYSLQKYYTDEGIAPLSGIKDTTVSPKLDGAAISLLYMDGNLVQALTRGDGIEGVDITEKILSRPDLIPKVIDKKEVFQVTGEIVAPSSIPNSRNYAAGALNLKDTTEFSSRTIAFFAYGVYPYFEKTFFKDMQVLTSLGFNTIYDEGIMSTYPCDGMVFRVNNNVEFDSLGYTAKHPKGAYAKKERQEAVETKLLGVEWNTGRTGRVTPVAILEPVLVGDAMVSRATLNNPGFIESLGLCIGDTVGVVRSGEIIPTIVYRVET